MAVLSPTINIKSASVDGKQITVEETTGVYDAMDNEGGYSGPDEKNPAPSDVARLLYCKKKNVSTDDDDISSFIDNSSPVSGSTSKEWTIDISSDGSGTLDGHYEFWILVLPVWDATVTYSSGNTVYYNGSIYQADSPSLGSAPGSVSGEWNILPGSIIEDIFVLLDDPSSYGSDDATDVKIVKSSNKNYVLVRNSEICFSRAVADNCTDCYDCSDDRDEQERLDKIYFFLNCATVSAAKGNYTKAEKDVEVLKSLCAGKDCVSC